MLSKGPISRHQKSNRKTGFMGPRGESCDLSRQHILVINCLPDQKLAESVNIMFSDLPGWSVTIQISDQLITGFSAFSSQSSSLATLLPVLEVWFDWRKKWFFFSIYNSNRYLIIRVRFFDHIKIVKFLKIYNTLYIWEAWRSYKIHWRFYRC